MQFEVVTDEANVSGDFSCGVTIYNDDDER